MQTARIRPEAETWTQTPEILLHVRIVNFIFTSPGIKPMEEESLNKFCLTGR